MSRVKLSVAIIQMKVGKERSANIKKAEELIDQAKSKFKELKLIVLPECFNSPYGVQNFAANVEDIPNGDTCKMLSRKASEHGIFIVGGTIPEKGTDGKLYNTCTVWNSSGNLIAVYRKMHLFDIDIPGKITFKESAVLSAGNELKIFEIEGIKVGLGICYDMRFSELSQLYRTKHNCDMLIYPGAFNMTTGPLHWQLLQRARAVDSQMFVLTCSPATGDEGYIAYGHSAINDPWGRHTSLEHCEGILYEELDFNLLDEIRANIPIYTQRRVDIYDTIFQSESSSKKETQ